MSDQISPLHDPASAMEAPARPGGMSLPSWRPRIRRDALAWDAARVLTAGILALIIVAGGFLRLTHGNWDRAIGEGARSGHLHPDERFLTQMSVDTRWCGAVEYLDTDKCALNPYNIVRPDGSRQTTFVYGTLPLFANKFVASHAATPYKTLDRVKLGGAVNGTLGFITGGRMGLPEQNFDNYDHYNLSGRWLSGITDILTIAFIFLLARQLANRTVGLLSAGLYAFAPFAIQNSHFYIVDPYVALFATVSLYYAVKSAKHGGWHNFVLAGVAAGLATACKTTAVALLPVVVLGVGIRAWGGIMPYVAPLWAGDTPEYAERRDGRTLDRSVVTLLAGSLVALLAAFVAYRLTMPYAFRSPDLADFLRLNLGHAGPLPLIYPDIMNPHWLQDIQNQEKLLSGEAFPPNWQWVGRGRWFWPLQQMVSWGMGPAFGITAWLGVAFAAIYAWVKRDGAWLVLLAWVLGYFAFMGAQFSLYMRYFLPLYPALAVFAGFVLYHAWQWASSGEPFRALGRVGTRLDPVKPAVPVAIRAGVVVVSVFTVLAGLAFYNIYRSPVTRAEASCWAAQNIPDGSVIGHEHWDDVVPYGQPDPACTGRTYGSVTFANYETDNEAKAQRLLDNLDQVDYFVPASRRLSGVIPRVPAVWPVTSRFYELLEEDPEALGFRKVAEFTSYPRIFGREFDDTGAEESFSVYDHPEVVFYEKTEEYSRQKASDALGAGAFIPGCGALPKDAAQNCILYRDDVLQAQREGGTWAEIFDPGSVFNRFPAFFFLLTMQLAAFSLVPLAIVVFRALPDRGYLLTKPLGVFTLAYLVYAPAGFGLVDFTKGTIAGMLAIMLLVGVVTGYRWREEVATWLRGHWRLVVGCEAIFLVAFLFSYWLRLMNPDLYHPFTGGEKPLDFAYFNGVLRTTDLTQGAVDPWYSGGYLNYYWWGFFIGATPTKLLGIVPEVAYNLVVPMFYSIAAAATFSLAYNLAEGTRRLMRRRPGGLSISPAGPIIVGLVAIFLVLMAGNLKSAAVLHDRFGRASPAQTDLPVAGATIETLGGLYESLAPEWSWLPSFVRGNDGANGERSFTALVRGRGPDRGYDWWAPSRALSTVPGEENQVPPITEFPFWTFLFADLHAHLMAIPFAMTVAAVGLGAVLNFTRLNTSRASGDRRREREVASWAMVLLMGLIVGALRWINSWDYPPFLLIGAAALILGERAKEGRWTLRSLSMGVLKSAVMGVASYVLFIVVARNYSQSYSSVVQSNQTTDLSDYLSHFGIFLFVLMGFVLFQLNRAITRTDWIRVAFFGRSRRREAFQTAPVLAALILLGIAIIWAFTTERWGVTGLALVGLLGVVIAAAHEIRSTSPTAPIMLFVYAMIALGLGLCGGVEILTLEGDVGRMNTVFKFYLHVWMMWGVASAFALWYVFGVMRPQDGFLQRMGELNASFVRAPRYTFAGVAAILLLMTLIFPYFGSRARVSERFDPSQGTGNDGLAWMESNNIIDGGHDNFYVTEYQTSGRQEHELRHTRDAINWMRENVNGTPTIIEAISIRYRSLYARFAINTGLPAVLGWDFHQSQQRVKFHTTIEQRSTDVNMFYTTEEAGLARQVLERYGVGWVIVGDEERFVYPEAGFEKFEDGLGGALELAYENPSIQIWRVLPEEERDASAVAP
jgi:YYY domain-containing protein